MASTGLALGLAAAIVPTRFLESFLVGVDPLAPLVFCIRTLGTFLLAALASLLPAWRPTRVDPLEVFRLAGEA